MVVCQGWLRTIDLGSWYNFLFAWNEPVASLSAQRLSRGVMVAHLVLVQAVGVRIPAGQPLFHRFSGI